MSRFWRAGHFWEVSPGEERFISSVTELHLIRLVPVLMAFCALVNLSDFLTTFVSARAAMVSSGLTFKEYNLLASWMFLYGPWGWEAALAAKTALVCIIGMFTIYGGRHGVSSSVSRLVNYLGFIILVDCDIYFGTIVFGNNIPFMILHHVI